jgi:SNF2 family DNA or RNA helicase
MAYVPDVGFFSLPTLLAQQHFTRTISASTREEWERFFLEQLPKLKEEFVCSVSTSLEPPERLHLFCKDLESDSDKEVLGTPSHWHAGFYWQSERGKAMADDVLVAVRRGERFLPTKAGLLDLTDQRFGWLSSIETLQEGEQFSLQIADFLKIQAHEEFSFDKTVSETAASFIDKLLNTQSSLPLDLSGFNATLRPYQERGVEWLWYLYLAGLSGLLCDDMGVGKTYQAMALMYAIKRRKQVKVRFLVVCPTSLLWHWREKCLEVLPNFKIFSYVGSDRNLEDFSSDYDLMLTTYGIWRNEAINLKQVPFEVAIFDELQIAKNHVSQIWAALSRVSASMRLGLTGTPVENQTRELKAVFDLVLPGYFPNERLFRRFYLRPIEKEGLQERRALLARFVRPFILRRRKEDVLPDLPQKVEDIYEAELIGEQKELYRQIASRQGVPIVQQLQDESTPIPYLHIFALLSSLKQICNHPASYLHDVENYRRYESGKWNLFEELIEEAMESGQKVVVFSQFLGMLDIFKLFLQSKNIGFSEIRGSTKERGKAIAVFHENDACRIFLGSLQAAGLGIDLTPASIVIHYDRWWNAAREQQATDRVHRLGQSRGVMVYKLMTTKSVEERVDRIIAHKSQLFEDLIRYDDHQIVKKLNRFELLELLQGIESI